MYCNVHIHRGRVMGACHELSRLSMVELTFAISMGVQCSIIFFVQFRIFAISNSPARFRDSIRTKLVKAAHVKCQDSLCLR